MTLIYIAADELLSAIRNAAKGALAAGGGKP